jgi:hypothetical protein
MKKNTKLVALFASVAVALLAFSVYQNTQASTPKEENMVTIDFNVFPAQDVIEVSKGQSARIPLIVEFPKSADYSLQLNVIAENATSEGKPLPKAASVALDKASVVLSSLNTPATDIGQDRIQKATGAFLTISAPADAAEGNYSYILEARRELSDSDGLAAGKIFTVNIN